MSTKKKAIIYVIIIVIIAIIALFVFNLPKSTDEKKLPEITTIPSTAVNSNDDANLPPVNSAITTFEECINAGNPILESSPRQCKTADGLSFTETIATPTNSDNNDRGYNINEEFTITLDSNPTTGYSWNADYDKEFLELVKQEYAQTGPEEMLGAGGVENFIFKALKAGTTRIDFSYQRPWEKGIEPIQTKSYEIIIK